MIWSAVGKLGEDLLSRPNCVTIGGHIEVPNGRSNGSQQTQDLAEKEQVEKGLVFDSAPANVG